MKNPKTPEIVPIAEQQPEKIDVADLVSTVGNFLTSAVENQNSTNLKIAEINKPIAEKQLELQHLQITNQHEVWTKTADAQISKDKREFTSNSFILGGILLFLMIVAFTLLLKGEYQFALSIITLLIGFISGYSLDKASKNQSKEQS